ncbi:MAG: carbohydrate ABC transporter substrate-binding protein, partial [Caldimonas sp.]
MRKTIVGVIAGFALAFAGQVSAQEKLTVWWVKGFYKSEDDALFEAIKKFEAK